MIVNNPKMYFWWRLSGFFFAHVVLRMTRFKSASTNLVLSVSLGKNKTPLVKLFSLGTGKNAVFLTTKLSFMNYVPYKTVRSSNSL